MPFTVFNFADLKGLVNVHFGGMRMDVRDLQEMLEYADYLHSVETARNEHYCMLAAGVSADMAPHGCTQACKLLVTFSTQGVHYSSAYAKFNSVGVKITAFCNSTQCLDKLTRKVSALGMTTYNGHRRRRRL